MENIYSYENGMVAMVTILMMIFYLCGPCFFLCGHFSGGFVAINITETRY